MEINILNKNNLNLLRDFLNNNISNNFRYFQKRSIEVINNHYITIIGTINKKSISYAHIDYDKNENIYWFGICILDEYQGLGYGKQLMNYIINEFNKNNNINELYLTVDKQNTIAIKLYEKYSFKIIEEHDYYYKMLLKK